MPRVEMPPKTLELIASYLLENDTRGSATSAGPGGTIPVTGGPASPGDAKALYARSCAACHGTEGRGDGPNAQYLVVRPTAHASAEAMAQRSDDALFDTIFAGGYIMNRSNLMPPFGATLTHEEIRGLVAYIRTLCKCQGPPWSRDPQPR
jgi:mono/diheme cytochrome c family protein